ncbi:MAG: bifunctional pyr operon transcriptional regulator/uracil phosphoribosyltransferase PyrR [Luteibaculaceae bacterium]
MKPVTILDQNRFALTVKRLAYQLIENHNDFSNAVMLGMQPRGVYLAERLLKVLREIDPKCSLPLGYLDTTFYRDDFRRRKEPISANKTKVDFIIENKNVILVDDVLYTGRTARAALDAMLAFGRPNSVEFLVLVDRWLTRDLPIAANYCGKVVNTLETERVNVQWQEIDGEDLVTLYTPNV